MSLFKKAVAGDAASHGNLNTIGAASSDPTSPSLHHRTSMASLSSKGSSSQLDDATKGGVPPSLASAVGGSMRSLDGSDPDIAARGRLQSKSSQARIEKRALMTPSATRKRGTVKSSNSSASLTPGGKTTGLTVRRQKKALHSELEKKIVRANKTRLALFKFSYPTKDLVFRGILKVHCKEGLTEMASKCIQVTSENICADILPVLAEKFQLQNDPLKYSVFFGLNESDARCLDDNENPLMEELQAALDPLTMESIFYLKHNPSKKITTSVAARAAQVGGLVADDALDTMVIHEDATTMSTLTSMRSRYFPAQRDLQVSCKDFIASKPDLRSQLQPEVIAQLTLVIRSVKDILVLVDTIVAGFHANVKSGIAKNMEYLSASLVRLANAGKRLLANELNNTSEVASALALIEGFLRDLPSTVHNAALMSKVLMVAGMCNEQSADRVPVALLHYLMRCMAEELKIVAAGVKDAYKFATAAVVAASERIVEAVEHTPAYVLFDPAKKGRITAEKEKVAKAAERLVFATKIASGMWPTDNAPYDVVSTCVLLTTPMIAFLQVAKAEGVFKASTYDLDQLRDIHFDADKHIQLAALSTPSESNPTSPNPSNRSSMSDAAAAANRLVVSDAEILENNVNSAIMASLNAYADAVRQATASLVELTVDKKTEQYEEHVRVAEEVSRQFREELESLETFRMAEYAQHAVENGKRPIHVLLHEVLLTWRLCTAFWPPPDANERFVAALRALAAHLDAVLTPLREYISDTTRRVELHQQHKLEQDRNREKIAEMNQLFNRSKLIGQSKDSPSASGAVPRVVTEEEFNNLLKKQLDEPGIVYEDKTQKTVRGGPLDKLIARLTSPSKPDPVFLDTFILTYHSFTTPQKLLDALILRYAVDFPVNTLSAEQKDIYNKRIIIPIRLRVFNALRAWLNKSFDDFLENPTLEVTFSRFTSTMADDLKTASTQLEKLLKRYKIYGPVKEETRAAAKNPPKSILPANLASFTLLDLDPMELARHMAMIDFELYKKIQPKDCLDLAWNKKELQHKARNLLATIDRFSKVLSWVVFTILSEKDLQKRVAVLRMFLRTAEACHEIHNFCSLFAIMGGLETGPIHRLKKTWDLLTAKEKELFGTLSTLVSSTSNHAKYRQEIESIEPPCIPFMGIYLTDLTFIEDGNPDYLPQQPTVINFRKRSQYANVINRLRQYQHMPYNFVLVRQVGAFVSEIATAGSEDEYYELSLQVEPREAS